jgi:hypothetical protein
MLGVIALLALLAWRAGPPGTLHLPFLATRPAVQRPACPAPPTRSGATHALTDAALASALRDPAHQDYRPASPITTFQAGQAAYLTFRIAGNTPGSATVLFCAPGAAIRGELTVPSNATGRFAQFSAVFTPASAGHGVATLSWNGQVAATLPFTIVAPQPR